MEKYIDEARQNAVYSERIEDGRIVSLSIRYKIGGSNVWSGKQERRGYEASVSTSTPSSPGWSTSVAGYGYRMMVKEVGRRSGKAFSAVLAKIERNAGESLHFLATELNGRAEIPFQDDDIFSSGFKILLP